MTEAIQKSAPFGSATADSAMDRENLSPEEWRDFAARMAARGVKEKRWENTGITMKQSIDALRVVVEENLLASLDLGPR